MSDGLALRLLGKPQVTWHDKTVAGFISSKAQALLFYLAVANRAHSRESLAALFWGEMPEAQASKNLRNVLSNLRALVAPYLTITRSDVAFNRDAGCWLDVEAFTSALGSDSGKKDLGTLHKALELYHGDFLDGFYVSDALAFEEWMLGQRSLFKNLSLQALHALVVQHMERAEFAAGIDYAHRLLSIEPWREETHRHLMILFARSRQRSAALAQYERCRRVLASELGVEPLAETTALYQRIRASAAPLHHNLPPQPTPFVGRSAELAEIAQCLNDPSVQLLTLVGPGGIGKTRLALEAASYWIDPQTNVEGRFGDGVYFVPFAAGSGSHARSTAVGTAWSRVPAGSAPETAQPALVAALAAVLHFEDQGPVHPQAQLLNYLRERNILLVLDNFEHLIGEAQPLADILRLAPHVKLLVTSRVRLNLQEEWLIEVKGLDYPPAPAGVADIASYSALALFSQQAQRVRAGFTPDESDWPHVVRICQLVEGVPLGIELAASWLRVLSCADIAQEIAQSLDFLTSPLQNVPERHRSVRAVFDHSWRLLAPEEQAMFRRLSVFRGFQREAAVRVAGIALPMLAALVDKSLLRRGASGRYELHDMLRQYAEEKLVADEAEYVRVHDAHCTYFADLLWARRVQLKSSDAASALSELSVEQENVRAAWNWAVSHRRVDEVDRFMECL
jgi:DNA-binding SARP family transcriptional activator/predicted ATPase